MPQGGMEDDETPVSTALRELPEEIGCDKAEVLDILDVVTHYDYPSEAAGTKRGRKYRGQEHRWVVMKFTGIDPDIDLGQSDGEFRDWKWMEPVEIINRATSFRRPVYEAVLLNPKTRRLISTLRESGFPRAPGDPPQIRPRKQGRRLDGISHALLRAIAYRDPYSASHMQVVSDLAVLIARKMGVVPKSVAEIQLGGLLHDLGKIGIPLEILIKPSHISEEEMSLVRGHARMGWEIISQLRGISPTIKKIVLLHHERLDGSGYPFGHKGNDIPFEARLVGIADVIESMTSHRPYRPALGLTAAIEEIRRYRGKRFDPEIVDAVIAASDEIEALLSEPTPKPQ